MSEILAIGGAAFSAEPRNLALDKYILDHTGKARPSVLLIPTARGMYLFMLGMLAASLSQASACRSVFYTMPSADNHARSTLKPYRKMTPRSGGVSSSS